MNFVPLADLSRKDLISVISLVRLNEKYCVRLYSKFKRSINGGFAVFSEQSPKNLLGIIYAGKTLFHCLPAIEKSLSSEAEEDFINSMKIFLKDFEICGLSGTEKTSSLILKALEEIQINPIQTNRYNLLELEPKNFICRQKTDKEKYKIIQCRQSINSKLFNELLELQRQYEIEEVLPSYMKFDPDCSRLNLRNALRTQICMALINEKGMISSKAATNAIGNQYLQLGGVFTKLEERKNNYARAVTSELLKKIFAQKKKAVLFVKKDNIAASNLYYSLGFTKIADYTIAYFNKFLLK